MGRRCNVALSHRKASPRMLEEALDPRPSLPLEFARVLTGSATVPAVSVATLAQIWNDDAPSCTNLRTPQHWTDRAHR